MEKIFVCGSGGAGLMLTGDTEDYHEFRPAHPPEKLIDFDIDGLLGAGILEDRRGCSWKLGEFIKFDILVDEVACGWTHVLFLSKGKVFSMGQGSFGQLGLGPIKTAIEPQQTGILNSTFVACGFRTSFAISNKGIFVFGENRKYELGTGTNSHIFEPFLINLQVEKIAAGNRHAIACKGNILYCWGNNEYGQLGVRIREIQTPLPLYFPNVIQKIDCGWFTSGFISENRLFLSGRGDFGQIGNGSSDHVSFFRPVLEDTSAFAMGSEHILAISKGKLFVWGWNEHGNLGTGSTENIYSPFEHPFHPSKIVAGSAISFVLSNLDQY